MIVMDLGEGLRKAIAKLTRATIIDAATIKEFNKELQKILLSSDVEVKLVLEFTKGIEDAALRSKPPKGLSHKDYITNLVYDGLLRMVGPKYAPKLSGHRILLMGLYGSGKTTMAAKLAKFYQDRGLSAAVVCCDVTRPAAYRQLETLASQANVAFFGIENSTDAADIAKKASEKFRDKQVVIFDTSGRNALDDQLTTELKAVAARSAPDEKILVVSADAGQIAGRQAREFDRNVKISGVIITKMDGSGRGGGALSAAAAAHAQVMFIGTGEKLGNIEPFDSDKFIGGLLGVPDIKSLVEHVQTAIKESGMRPEELESDELNFETFYSQLKAMGSMGPLKNILGMAGAPDVPKDMLEQGEEKLKRYKIIISSMTKEERKNERLLHNHSRVSRIASGSGATEKEVNGLISEFNKMRKIFDTMKNDRSLRRRFSKF